MANKDRFLRFRVTEHMRQRVEELRGELTVSEFMRMAVESVEPGTPKETDSSRAQLALAVLRLPGLIQKIQDLAGEIAGSKGTPEVRIAQLLLVHASILQLAETTQVAAAALSPDPTERGPQWS